MAHIPDGFLSLPVLAGTALAASAALAVAARRSRARLADREAPLLGAVTAFVFAAQMFNVPIGAGTSTHLMGGTLAAVLVGPGTAMLSLFGVVLVQALLFQDGGVAALGANTLNLAVLAPLVGWGVHRWLSALLPDRLARVPFTAAVGGFVSVAVVGAAVALQIAASGLVPPGRALAVVGGAHLLAGVAEAVITGGVLALALRSRPALVPDTAPAAARRRRVRAFTGAAVAVALGAVFLASAAPDALETAAHALGIRADGVPVPAPFPGYEARLGGAWLAGLVGVGVAFAAGWAAMRAATRRRTG